MSYARMTSTYRSLLSVHSTAQPSHQSHPLAPSPSRMFAIVRATLFSQAIRADMKQQLAEWTKLEGPFCGCVA
eukprot:6192783-Pleurochrysis_carterae.AAC.1